MLYGPANIHGPFIGRQISKRSPNSRSLVNQGYITEKNRIIVLNRAHAVKIELRRVGEDIRLFN